MDALNSTESRKVSGAQNMKTLEKAIAMADQRIRMRRDANARAQLYMTFAFTIPLSAYMIYHLFAPTGFMQSYKAASGAYMYYPQTFMYPQKRQTAIWRPEIEFKEQGASLSVYSKRIEERRAAGDLPEGVHHPTTWHWSKERNQEYSASFQYILFNLSLV